MKEERKKNIADTRAEASLSSIMVSILRGPIIHVMDSCIRLVRTIVIKKQGRNHISRFISISMKDKLSLS